MAGWTGKRANVSYTKPAEPAFLREFKDRVGYKEGSGVEAKFAKMPLAFGDDLEDGEDELPQVVTLNSDDLSQEEYDAIRLAEKIPEHSDANEEQTSEIGIKVSEPSGKIMFRPSKKRSQNNSDVVTVVPNDGENSSSSKRVKNNDVKDLKLKSKSKREKIATLLSFNEEEDDD